jgi:diguanylate cyclase (GGDEF)-like protein/PAS domain S-box-containing protein
MYSATDVHVAIWWAKAGNVGLGFIPAAIYYYSGQLWGDAEFRKRTSVIWSLSIIFAIIIITTDMLFGSLYHYWWGFYPKYGVTSIPFLLYFFGVLIDVVRHHWAVYRRAAKGSIQQIQAKSVVIAFSVGYLASFDYFAACGIPLYPFGYIPIFFFLLLSGRAIVRYRLLAITPALAAHQIIDTMHDALIVLDREGFIRLINQATCSLLGYSEQDLVGKRPTNSMINDIPFAELLESFVQEGLVRDYEVDCQTQESTTHTLSLTTSILRDHIGEPLATVCVARDITEHKRADEDLKQSLSLLRATLESTADGILVANRAGIITTFNARYAEMWHLPEDILRSLNDQQALNFVTDQLKDPKAFLDNVKQLYERPEVESFDVLEFKDGRVFERYSKPQWIGHQPVGRVWSFRDVTERKQTEEELKFRNIILSTQQETSLDGILIVDENGYGISCNQRFLDIWGFQDINLILSKHHIKFLQPMMHKLTNQETFVARLEYVYKHGDEKSKDEFSFKDGRVIDRFTTPMIAPDRTYYGRVWYLRDITERRRYEEELEYQSGHDKLTGLPNRNLLKDRIQQAISFGKRHERKIGVLFIGLDHFKYINDSMGHEAGDRLLKAVAERLTNSLRSVDTVAKHGGDGFVVVLSDMEKEEDAAHVARKILEDISLPIIINELELGISCSIGISVYPKDGQDAQTLLKNADAAMFRVKEKGRGDFGFFTAELNERAMTRMTMEKHLRKALEKEELLLHYQPQVELNTGRIIGMEALLRWQSGALGMVPPGHFIPVAEETGLIVPIGEWVLQTACRQNKAWQDAGLPHLVIAVNLSVRQFQKKDISATVARILGETGLAPHCLELEVVESMVMQDVVNAAALLNELKSLGVLLAIDDFGTGYSSLSYLKRFPFSKLKIDISFVRDITVEPESAAIAKSIIAMGHALNLRVIAEGIETEGQLSYLRNHGCDEMQGFFFSRPIPASDFEKMLRENRHLDIPTKELSSERTLLMVDDEPNVLAALKRVLQEDAYRVITATSAAEGFEILATNHVCVVISDLRMPQMNGIEFLERVKDLYPETIRIVLSASTDLDATRDAINRGAVFKFLAKPWNDEQFLETIRDAFRHYKPG